MINCVKAIHPRRCAKDELLLDVSRESNNISILHKDDDFSTYVWHIYILKYINAINIGQNIRKSRFKLALN